MASIKIVQAGPNGIAVLNMPDTPIAEIHALAQALRTLPTFQQQAMLLQDVFLLHNLRPDGPAH